MEKCGEVHVWRGDMGRCMDKHFEHYGILSISNFL